jgi:hypothetical protein
MIVSSNRASIDNDNISDSPIFIHLNNVPTSPDHNLYILMKFGYRQRQVIYKYIVCLVSNIVDVNKIYSNTNIVVIQHDNETIPSSISNNNNSIIPLPIKITQDYEDVKDKMVHLFKKIIYTCDPYDNVALYLDARYYNFIYNNYDIGKYKKEDTLLLLKKNINKLVIYSLDKLEIKTDEIFLSVILIYNYILQNNNQILLDRDIKALLTNIPLCNYFLFNILIKKLNDEKIENLNLEFYMTNELGNSNTLYMDTIHNYCSIYLYCYKLNRYLNDVFKIYSLGSSLEKFNFIWNIKNAETPITIIPFSGNILDHPDDFGDDEPISDMFDINDIRYSTHIQQYRNKSLPNTYIAKPLDEGLTHFLINTKKYTSVIENYDNLLHNNSNFQDLVNKLTRGEKVLITDVMSRGKSLYTLLLLLQKKKVPISRLYFLYIMEQQSILSDISLYINTIAYNLNYFRLNYCIYNIEIIPDLYLDRRYFQNSERTNSRCIPKYGSEKWSNPMNDIYIEEDPDRRGYSGPNYINCNMHKILYYMYTSCFYDNFISKKLSLDITNYNKVIEEIKHFVSSTGTENMMNGYDKKYLKYKTKYLKLKSN